MLSIEDCFEFCELGMPEIEAISHHEHVPLIVAAEIGYELIKTPAGLNSIEAMLQESADDALSHGHPDDAEKFLRAYRDFHDAHPCA